jgi:radical SAM superfamily enzyme YgiQ (UPF0313 family)
MLQRVISLDLMYIAAVLNTAGYKAEISDAFMTDSSFLKVGNTIEVYALWKNKRGNTRQVEKADIVGITSPLTCQAENTVRVGNIAKEMDQSILTVVGGPHVAVSTWCQQNS